MNLDEYGYTMYFKEIFDTNYEPSLHPARVTAEHKSNYILATEAGELPAEISGKYRFNLDEKGGYPVVGDFVAVQIADTGDRAVIHGLLPRKTGFKRRDAWDASGVQMLAANFDTVFICMSLNNDFKLSRLERYLIMAKESGADIACILTKADLCADVEIKAAMCEAVCGDMPVYTVSAQTGQGFEQIRHYFEAGKTVAALGSSGVGKSTLVNALFGKQIMKTSEIRSDDDKGRHTTVHRQLIVLPSGGLYIDTPGLREIGVVEAEGSVSDMYSDIERLTGSCKFSDCKHQSEPGCAVKAAIAEGVLSRKRWESYMGFKREARYSDKKNAIKEKQNKVISKYQRKQQKTDYTQTACYESFTCKVCGAFIVPEGAGSNHRNHCPKCLSSVHVDNEPGDRESLCDGIMDPIGVWVRKNGEWAIIHRCKTCGALSSNRIAADDNPTMLMSIAVKPLAMPPFPLEQMEKNFNA